MQKQNKQNRSIWRNLVDTEIAYIQNRQDFLQGCHNRIEPIKAALENPAERGTALRLIEYLTIEERQSLLSELVDLATVGHSDIELCRQAILSVPKNWLLAHIENFAEPLLQHGTDEEYRRLLELYVELDWELTQRLAKRALEHQDPDIREAGQDFLSNGSGNFSKGHWASGIGHWA